MYTNYKSISIVLSLSFIISKSFTRYYHVTIYCFFKRNGNVNGPTIKNKARVCRQIMRIQNLAAHRNELGTTCCEGQRL